MWVGVSKIFQCSVTVEGKQGTQQLTFAVAGVGGLGLARVGGPQLSQPGLAAVRLGLGRLKVKLGLTFEFWRDITQICGGVLVAGSVGTLSFMLTCARA